MTPIAIQTLISIAGIWCLYFFFYRDYRLDKVRQSLFALRDELFDLALDERIAFDDPAYKMLRDTINGMIQFGHRYGLCDVVLFDLFGRTQIAQDMATEYRQHWNAAIDQLTPEVRDELISIRRRAHVKILEQVVLTSFILSFTVVTVVSLMILKHLGGRLGHYFRQVALSLAERSFISKIFGRIDANSHMRATH